MKASEVYLRAARKMERLESSAERPGCCELLPLIQAQKFEDSFMPSTREQLRWNGFVRYAYWMGDCRNDENYAARCLALAFAYAITEWDEKHEEK